MLTGNERMIQDNCCTRMPPNNSHWLERNTLSVTELRVSCILNEQVPAKVAFISFFVFSSREYLHFSQHHADNLKDEKVQEKDEQKSEQKDEPFEWERTQHAACQVKVALATD